MEKCIFPGMNNERSTISHLLPKLSEDEVDPSLDLLMRSSVIDGAEIRGHGIVQGHVYGWRMAIETRVKSIAVVPDKFFDIKGRSYPIDQFKKISVSSLPDYINYKDAVIYKINSKSDLKAPKAEIIFDDAMEGGVTAHVEPDKKSATTKTTEPNVLVKSYPYKQNRTFASLFGKDAEDKPFIEDQLGSIYNIGDEPIEICEADYLAIIVDSNDDYYALLGVATTVDDGDLDDAVTWTQPKTPVNVYQFKNIDMWLRFDSINALAYFLITKYEDDVKKHSFTVEQETKLRIKNLLEEIGLSYADACFIINNKYGTDEGEGWVPAQKLKDLRRKYEDDIKKITPVTIDPTTMVYGPDEPITPQTDITRDGDDPIEPVGPDEPGDDPEPDPREDEWAVNQNITEVTENTDGESRKAEGKLWAYINPRTMQPYADDYWFHQGEPFYVKSLTMAPKGKRIKGNKITIRADQWPGMYMMVGETYIRSRDTGEDERMQIKFPLCKVRSDHTLTLQADGDPTTFNLNLEVAKPKSGIMMELTAYEIAEKMLEGENGCFYAVDGSTEVLSE